MTEVSQMNFIHDPTGPESSPQAQQALGSIAAQFYISPEVSKRKQSDVEGSDKWQAQKIQRTHVSNLDQFDALYATGTAQVDESRSGDVCDLQNCQESAAGSPQASYGDVGYLSVSPVIRPQAQLVQGESQGAIVNSGLGGHLETRLVPIKQTGSGMSITEQVHHLQISGPFPLTGGSQENETHPPNQAKEGIHSCQMLETDGLSKLGEFGKGLSVDSIRDVFPVDHKSVSHGMVNHSTSSSKTTKSCTFGAHPYGYTLAKQAEYLERVSSLNLSVISKQVHKSFLQAEGLDRFANLNWQIQDYEDLHEIVKNYDEKTLTSRWHSQVIDLGDDALAKIFPLPRSTKEPSFKATSFRSKFFPVDAMRRNGFLLSQCNNQLIIERLKFLWETVHVKTVASEIPYYMVSLFEESFQEKNWFGYFLQGFRKELKKGRTSKGLQLGSHMRLVLADQAPLVTNVDGNRSREESTERKTTFLNCDDTKAEIEVLEKEGQTLQAEGQASEARYLTQVNEEVMEGTLLIPPCVSRGDPSTSINDFVTQKDLLDSRELLERDLKIVQGQNQILEKQKSSLTNEISTLLAEKGQLVATHQKEKEDLLHEFRHKENQLKANYVAQLSHNKAKMSSTIERQVESIAAQFKKIQEAKKKDVETIQVLLKEHKKVDDKCTMAEDLFNQVNRFKAQLVENLKEMDVKMEADRAELDALWKEKDDKMKLSLKANRNKLEEFEKEMGKKLKSSINNFHIEGEQNVKKFVAEAIPILLKCLSSDDKPFLQEEAAKVLKNATSEDDYFRFQVSKEAGAIAILLKCMAASDKPNLQACAGTALANLSIYDDDDSIKFQIENETGSIDVLVKCLCADGKPSLQTFAVTVLANLASENSIGSRIAKEEEVIPILLKCLSANNKPSVQEAAARVLGKLTCEDDFVESQIFKEAGGAAILLKYMSAKYTGMLGLQDDAAAVLAAFADHSFC